jgi:hypothetical protein
VKLIVSSITLGLAWFAAINLATSLVSSIVGRAIAGSGAPSARVLLSVRLLPAVASTLFVVGIFLPAHWRFEPAATEETFGIVLRGLAAVGAALLARSAWRVVSTIWREYRLEALTGRMSSPLMAGAMEVRRLPGISLAGILRPRILVGSEALAALTPAELDVAVSHEIAHQRVRDNLKRFLLFCVPDFLGWTPTGRRLEERWQAEAECQADAYAVGGDERRAIVLASALVKVAKLTSGRGAHDLHRQAAPSLAMSAFHVASLLETRVRRLVAGPQPVPRSVGRFSYSMMLLAVGVPAAVWLLDFSHTFHVITEAMVTVLP